MPDVLIISANFYTEISKMLMLGAKEVLENNTLSYESVEVPGALEIPAAISMGIASGKYKGFLALGCVIRGQTSHYDEVCRESAHGLNYLAMEHKAAIGNGIITVENQDQALERASLDRRNKGGAAAQATVRMIQLREQMLLT
jgi:6,7-dimethyl-8-ribityllumazine synthase